jgi:hypothetical protein
MPVVAVQKKGIAVVAAGRQGPVVLAAEITSMFSLWHQHLGM